MLVWKLARLNVMNSEEALGCGSVSYGVVKGSEKIHLGRPKKMLRRKNRKKNLCAVLRTSPLRKAPHTP